MRETQHNIFEKCHVKHTGAKNGVQNNVEKYVRVCYMVFLGSFVVNLWFQILLGSATLICLTQCLL